MDQVKIGKFIAHMRKQNDLTQKKLAQKLGISDKTISKWECGKGMPDNVLMLPLCDALGITVNELLSGESLPDNCYSKKAEENIMNLLGQNEEILEKSRRSNISYIVGEVLAILVLCIVFFVSADSGKLQYFIDVPALAVIFTLVVLVLLATHSAGSFLRAFRIGWSRTYRPEKDEIWESLQSVRLMSAAVILSGGICGIMECIIVAPSVTRMAENGHYFAMAGVSIFYSLVVILLLLPLRHRLEMLFYREQSIGIR